jgi:hypothetical protein
VIRSPRLQAIAVALALSAVFGFVSRRLGQDANWDLKNYHLYNAFQLLEGRFGFDLGAASMQGFFNPILDVPYYLLSRVIIPDHPPLVAALMGLNSALLALIVFGILAVLFRGHRDISCVARAAALFIGATGAASISELGTTFNDILPAAFALFGVLIVLRELDRESATGTGFWISFGAAGIAVGLGVGGKLSAAFLVPAFVVALVLVMGLRRRTFVALALFSAGCAAGGLLMGGWWSYKVYAMTGNPVFPLYNQIFRSDWYPPVAFFDQRWHPRGLAQTLAFPFFWTRSNYLVVTEVEFADSRFAAGYLGLALTGLMLAASYGRAKLADAWPPRFTLTPGMRFVLWFIVVSYVVWQVTFSILRYAVGIEALIGIPILLAVWGLAGLIDNGTLRRHVVTVAMVVIAGALYVTTHYPNWGRVPYGRTVYSVEAPSLPPNSLVVVSGVPNSYVVPFLQGQGVRFVGVSATTVEARGYKLWNETARLIAEHAGPMFVLERTDGGSLRAILGEMGLRVEPGRCVPIPTNLDRDVQLCDAHR